jgi:sporulation protein YlmC with PRC-barrel domain
MNTFEADNETGKNHDGPHANWPLRFLTASSIIGDHIHNPLGDHLGDIKDIMINIHDGKIEYVVVEMGGFLGIGEKYFAIPFSLLKVNIKDDSFTLNQSKETLENSPGFDKDHWPETNTHFFDNYNSYWGSFMGSNVSSF